MGEEALERAMVDFMARKFDILLATTIVENGLDIPNVNTILINRADRYGLSQLYQLRGRVGRSDRPAYAYLLIPPGDTLSPVARKRLAAIREFSDLGSGFRVAALDLEIRGAGNLLGGEQSGHIEAIGFEMYMKLLEQTVRELKGEEIEDDTRATVNLNVDLRIDSGYVPEQAQRLALYRRVAAARKRRRARRDRGGGARTATARCRRRSSTWWTTGASGSPPTAWASNPSTARARRSSLHSRARGGRTRSASFGWSPSGPDVTLAPPSSLKLDLNWTSSKAVQGTESGRASSAAAPAPSAPPGRARPGQRVLPGRVGPAARSWWTARATEDEVRPGFSKEAILRPEKEDPRGPTGVLTRVEQSLERTSRIEVRLLSSRGSMKKTYLARGLVVLLGLVTLGVAAPRAEIIERVLVKVNSDILTQSDLEARQSAAIRAKRENPQTMSNAELTKMLAEITPQIIVDAVDELLLLQRGRELGYHLTDEKFKAGPRQHQEGKQDRDRGAVPAGAEGREPDARRSPDAPREVDDHPAGAEQRGARAHLGHRGRGEGVLRRAQDRVHDAGDDDAARDPDRRCSGRVGGRGGQGEGGRAVLPSCRQARASRRRWPTSRRRRRRPTAA